MPLLYIGIGFVAALGGIFGLITIAVNEVAKENVERCQNEDRDSFLRCQPYLDKGDEE